MLFKSPGFPKITGMSVKSYSSAHLWHWSLGSAELVDLTGAISQILSLSWAASTTHEMHPLLNFHPSYRLLLFGWLYWVWECSDRAGIHCVPSTEPHRQQWVLSPKSFNSTPLNKTTGDNPLPHWNSFFFSTFSLRLPLIWEHHVFLPILCTSAVLI